MSLAPCGANCQPSIRLPSETLRKCCRGHHGINNLCSQAGQARQEDEYTPALQLLSLKQHCSCMDQS
jgi:hypothetical protein